MSVVAKTVASVDFTNTMQDEKDVIKFFDQIKRCNRLLLALFFTILLCFTWAICATNVIGCGDDATNVL